MSPAEFRVIVVAASTQIDERFLFYVTQRPARLDLHYFPLHTRGAFGHADRYKIIGESYALYRALESLAFAAQTLEHVLLHGDTGTGKELFARLLHALSSRAVQPFVARNSAAIPGPLLESELCSNIAGYPQATMPARVGMFESAAGGMMFLDEIGEMAHALQALLLRVMDAGEYWRLGDRQARRSDFRMICATNRRLEELKVDFLPRLKRIVELPSLQDRREDIPLLVRSFARSLVRSLAEKHAA